MSWWKRLLPSARSTSPPRIEVLPGRLHAIVYQHELPTPQGNLACWTYVTEGLMNVYQPEVSMTLLRLPRLSAPQEPFHLFSLLYQLAAEGRIVRAGDLTQFGTQKFLERHLAYIPAQPISDLPFSPDTILAILITDDELAAAQEFGILRLMSQLGKATQYFPCPPWSDHSRPGIDFRRIRRDSILGRLRRVHGRQIRIVQTPGGLVMRLSRSAHRELLHQMQDMPEDLPVVFLTDLDPEADGCLFWHPGQADSIAISPADSPGENICGCFVAFVPDIKATGGKTLEDGFSVSLSPVDWELIRLALLNGDSLDLGATSGRMPFSIEWDDIVP